MSDLELLLEKVRTAEAGSRELDLHFHARVAQRGEWAEGDILYALTDVEGTTAPPHYTTSIDAIVALIERELPGRSMTTGTGPKTAYGAIAPSFLEQARTMPLALCAAFLSAKIQTGSGETGE